MTRDALSARDASASEHTNVSGGGEQEDDAEEEAHASGGVWVGVVEALDAESDDGGGSAKADQERGPVRPAYVPAATGEPCGGDHVERDNAADDVAPLGFHNGERERAGGQRHHRDGEDVSRDAMQTAAFADGHGERAGEQANRTTEDVQNQERETHASTSFEHLRLLPRPEEATTRHTKQETTQYMQETLPCRDVSSKDTLHVCSRLLTSSKPSNQ